VYAEPGQVARGEGLYCTPTCKYAAMRGRETRPGTSYIRKDGYRAVKVGVRQYKLEHRMVVEASIGRPLRSDEEVHHINGDKLDNRPENLKVVNPTEHQAIHDFGPAMRQRVTKTCERCGAEFSRRPNVAAVQRFCSRSCRSAATGGFARKG
jgi:hypothetical protein